jgi:hypothetical protein
MQKKLALPPNNNFRVILVPVANSSQKMIDSSKKLKLFGLKGQPSISDIGQG